MKRQIVNIINFVRGNEPRQEMDLLYPIEKQLEILNEYDFPSTFLLMYDALTNPKFTTLLERRNKKTELGLWLEISEPHCKDAGVQWHGRYIWDWHANAGFTIAYTQEDREKLVDTAFEKFKEIYGEYPRSFGAWVMDAHTIDYISKKYDTDAACICRDQWGTDGYTLWGGYYNQAYYPSKKNMFCPAQSADTQINVPVFRMLGSDPIYQYDCGLDYKGTGAAEWQDVNTLEPSYHKDGGGDDKWVDWYLKENFSQRCISFGYTQAGQENSFGWDLMKHGYIYQCAEFDRLIKEGKLEVITLGETGKWYKEQFKSTPASVVSALTDRCDEDRKSVWYCSKNYRINLYTENGKFHIRDVFAFRDDYQERYLVEKCETAAMTYDNLPIVDGNRTSGEGIRAGLYPTVNGKTLSYTGVDYKEDDKTAYVTFKGTEIGDVKFTLAEAEVKVEAEKEFTLEYKTAPSATLTLKGNDGNVINYSHNGYDYSIEVKTGSVDEAKLVSENGKVIVSMI